MKILKGVLSTCEANGDWWQFRWSSPASAELQIDFRTSAVLPKTIRHKTEIKFHIMSASKTNEIKT